MANKTKIPPVGGIEASDEDTKEMAEAMGVGEDDAMFEEVDTESFELADDPDKAFTWEPKGGLTAPAPLSGMEQKWVRRIAPNGTNDAQHLSYQLGRAGWQPRRFATVPEGERGLFPMTSDRAYGDIITSGDLMLCQRPKALGDARRAYYAKRTNRQIELVNQEISAVNQRAQAGFGDMHVAEHKRRVGTARIPIVASD